MFIIHRIVFGINSIFILALLFSYLAPFISPELMWYVAFLGLAYPVLLIINMIFILYWLVFFKMKFLFSLAAIIIGWSFVPRFVQLGEKKLEAGADSSAINLLTFNVKYFGLYDSTVTKDKDLFIDKLNRIQPDVMCFQEFQIQASHIPTNELRAALVKFLEKYRVATGTAHPDLNHIDNLVIFSKLPTVRTGGVERENGSGNYTIYADVIKNKDTIRIINTHLQSIGFKRSDYAVIQSLMGEKDSINFSQLRSVGAKMKYAFMLRARQVEAIRNFIEQSPYKVIMCGDFNDSPVSYAYRTIKYNMKDAFVEAGSGLGRTYIGAAPSLRIDYLLAHPRFSFYNYYAKGFDFSDHKMVTATLTLKD
jgi:endonuclease/exonuclease/phosphatase family metal-dependent hydrolase